MMTERHEGRATSHLIGGLVLIALGVLFLLQKADLFYLGSLFEFWPLILVVMGIVKLSAGNYEERKGGLWLLVIGCWLLLSSLEIFGLHYGSSWPLLLVGIGGVIIWQSIAQPNGQRKVR